MPTVIQPGHRYLLFLHYLAEGDFYTIEKVWLLLNGTTIAVEPDDVARAKKGASKYSGMPEAEFLASVEEQLKSQ